MPSPARFARIRPCLRLQQAGRRPARHDAVAHAQDGHRKAAYLIASTKVLKPDQMTAYGQADHRRRTREAGFHDHLTKPVTYSQLLTALERVITSTS